MAAITAQDDTIADSISYRVDEQAKLKNSESQHVIFSYISNSNYIEALPKSADSTVEIISMLCLSEQAPP